MGRITDLRIKDVRCFAGKQSAKLNRITLLVGENGTGKSTFLGCYKALAMWANLIDFRGNNYFDEAPFRMGSFDTIARSGKNKFEIGGRFEGHCHNDADLTFVSDERGNPVEQAVAFRCIGKDLATERLEISRKDASNTLRITGPKFRFDLDRSMFSHSALTVWLSRYVRYGHLAFDGDYSNHQKSSSSEYSLKDEAGFARFVTFFRSQFQLPAKPSFAVEALYPELPPRKRFYPPGSAYLDFRNPGEKEHITKIGRKLGLWKNVSLDRGLDTKDEIRVETPSGWRNLMDVDYGIHSMLWLARSLHSADPETVFLLQQPENRVNPVVQARLAQWIAESRHGFIIETHSDHFLDRLRICVMNKTIRKDDLSIIYFEPSQDGRKSIIYNLNMDGNGNFLDVPIGYRSFYMKETNSLLGFEE